MWKSKEAFKKLLEPEPIRRPVYKAEWVVNEEGYEFFDKSTMQEIGSTIYPLETDDLVLYDGDLIGSQVVSGFYAPVLDVDGDLTWELRRAKDYPSMLRAPSASEGHEHWFWQHTVDFQQYARIMATLVERRDAGYWDEQTGNIGYYSMWRDVHGRKNNYVRTPKATADKIAREEVRFLAGQGKPTQKAIWNPRTRGYDRPFQRSQEFTNRFGKLLDGSH